MRCWSTATLTGLLLGPLLAASAAAIDGATAEEIKAVAIYRLPAFVEWPRAKLSRGAGDVVVCLIGEVAFSQEMASFHDEPVKSGKLRVRRIETPEQAGDCHVLVLGEGEAATAALAAVEDQPILTVSDRPGFARSGGMVGFRVGDKKMRLRINRRALARSGLVVSSQLLALAQIED